MKFRLFMLIESFAFAIPHTHCKVKILMLNIAICQYRMRRVVSKHETQNLFHRSRYDIFFHQQKGNLYHNHTAHYHITITTTRTTGRRTMGCILALSKTHMAASTTRSRCNFVCYPRLPDIKLVQVQSTSRGCHPEKPSIMKGQPGNHTVLVGTNLTLPCELMVSVIKSKTKS